MTDLPCRCWTAAALALGPLMRNISPTLNPTLVTVAAAWSRVTNHTNTVPTALTDERYTPEWVLDLVTKILGGIDLDPCADPKRRVAASNHFTKEENGLERPWSGRVFLNPPFSNSSDWVRHLSVYLVSGAVTEAVVLLPVMALTNKSARLLLRQQAEGFVLLERKLSFLDSNYTPLGDMSSFPFALIYVGPRFYNFLDVMGDIGIACTIKKHHSQGKILSCDYCGKAFSALRSTRKFCGTTCRVEAHRKKVQERSGI